MVPSYTESNVEACFQYHDGSWMTCINRDTAVARHSWFPIILESQRSISSWSAWTCRSWVICDRSQCVQSTWYCCRLFRGKRCAVVLYLIPMDVLVGDWVIGQGSMTMGGRTRWYQRSVSCLYILLFCKKIPFFAHRSKSNIVDGFQQFVHNQLDNFSWRADLPSQLSN
jgi:hypothetical protein